MKFILTLILLTSSNSFELKPFEVPLGMSCSQLHDKLVYYVKNPNYIPGSGQIWIQSFYNKQPVGGYLCEFK